MVFRRLKYDAESAFGRNVSIGPVNIYEVKHPQRHLLAFTQNYWFWAPLLIALTTSSDDIVFELMAYFAIKW